LLKVATGSALTVLGTPPLKRYCIENAELHEGTGYQGVGKEGTDIAREASEMILADDNFATIVTAVREGRVVWDNLRKVILVNTPVNNAQGLSVLFGLACGLQKSPLTAIQVLYSNLICAVTLGFV
jgi:magnesium-transporting ATPase (P-type)